MFLNCVLICLDIYIYIYIHTHKLQSVLDNAGAADEKEIFLGATLVPSAPRGL